MPGHWLLARMGKRVLRPGGLELTSRMLAGLDVGEDDRVVELAPGLGATARLTLRRNPASYVGVERDPDAAAAVRRVIEGPNRRCLVGTATKTGLEDGSASVVYGEAMLTMQEPAHKQAIIAEAFRVLEPGGRYGIHELALTPDGLAEERKREVKQDLRQAIRVGARPLTGAEWRELLEAAGFEIERLETAPMHLLEPPRLVRDEGLFGALRIAFNVLRTPAARRRILAMRATFRKHGGVMCAVALIARKPLSEGTL
ncbi:MAG: methyltransferase domain-containing protein [Acidobacteriota bacterium]